MGKFSLLSTYGRQSTVAKRSLFSGRNSLKLHDVDHGQARVERATLDGLSIGRVLSTGHDVMVRESFFLSVVVPVIGTIRIERKDRVFDATPGSAILMGRGRRSTRVEPDADGRYLAYVCLLPCDAFEGLNGVEQGQGMLLDAGQRPEFRHSLHLIRLLVDMIQEESGLLDRTGAARSWCELVTASLSHSVDIRAGDRAPVRKHLSPAHRHVSLAEDYMHAHLEEIHTIADVAGELGISIRTLEYAFRKTRGDSPAHVLSQIRLHAARRSLLAPDGPKTVTDLCLGLGIGHHGRFSAAYRRQFDETPSETLRRR